MADAVQKSPDQQRHDMMTGIRDTLSEKLKGSGSGLTVLINNADVGNMTTPVVEVRKQGMSIGSINFGGGTVAYIFPNYLAHSWKDRSEEVPSGVVCRYSPKSKPELSRIIEQVCRDKGYKIASEAGYKPAGYAF